MYCSQHYEKFKQKTFNPRIRGLYMNFNFKPIVHIIFVFVLFNNIQNAQSSLDQHINNFIEPPMDCWVVPIQNLI